MKKNIGLLDSYIRISMGLMMLAMGIIKKSVCYIAIGSCKVSEGVTRFCPILYMLNYSTCECECEHKHEAAILSEE